MTTRTTIDVDGTVTVREMAPEELAEIAATLPTAAELLAAERAQMNPFAAAFWQAMKQVPAPGFDHLLDRVEQTIAAARAVDPYAGIVLWADKVTQVVRAHPDMEAFRTQFGASETELDDLFRLALQIEAGA